MSAWRSEGAFSAEDPARGDRDVEGLRVLVVDDDNDGRDLLRTVLESRKAEVFVAASAPEAMALLVQERPDVLVSDIAMPDEDGYTLIRRIRALEDAALAKTPAVAVTAYAGSADRGRALAAGFDRYLSKPVDLVEFVSTVGALHALR